MSYIILVHYYSMLTSHDLRIFFRSVDILCMYLDRLFCVSLLGAVCVIKRKSKSETQTLLLLSLAWLTVGEPIFGYSLLDRKGKSRH